MLLLSLFAALHGAACQTAAEKNEIKITEDAKTELQKIHEMYTPADCFRAGFVVEAALTGQGAQQANGSVRVDNKQKRMRFIFTESYLGITLSQITITEQLVFLTNPRVTGQRIPLNQFEVAGLGNNSIRLPFRLFQDLIYARIPEEVFSNAANTALEKNTLNVSINASDEDYRYVFEDRRLRHLSYLRKSTADQIEVDLAGQYGSSVFPSTILMRTFRGGQPLDRLLITFNALSLEARCTDVHFPMQ